MADNEFDIEQVQNKETYNNLPLGWVVLFIGLIVFGAFYIYSFTPELSNWSQISELNDALNVK